jgi:polysaccharide export outer membrane protein
MLRFIATLAIGLWATAISAQTATYVIQPGDRLSISVLEDPSLNTNALVRPDGRISMPLAGSLQAAGVTPEQLQSAIRDNLSRDFVSPPTVTVALVALGAPGDQEAAAQGPTAQIYVLGEVSRPGVYEVELPIDALRLLALAGGPSVFAARQRVQIRRRMPDNGETVMLFDYEAVEEGLTPSALVPLQDGDVVVVPERSLFE